MDISGRFDYHKPDQRKSELHTDVRNECHRLADLLNTFLPEGREKSLAITHLEETMFWSNAAIARSNPLD
jgi:hypothetical protein